MPKRWYRDMYWRVSSQLMDTLPASSFLEVAARVEIDGDHASPAKEMTLSTKGINGEKRMSGMAAMACEATLSTAMAIIRRRIMSSVKSSARPVMAAIR